MNADLDRALGHFATVTPDANLCGLEERVLAGIRARRQQTMATQAALTVAVVALLMGVGSAILPSAHASATSAAAFGVPSALLPSSLLLSGH